MRMASAVSIGILAAMAAEQAVAWPVLSRPFPTIAVPAIPVQRSMPRELVPLTPDQIAAIAKAIAAQKEHVFPTEDAATADGRKLLQKNDNLGAHDAFVALAMSGNAAAIYMLGVMYTSGLGVKQDFPMAAKLFLICGDAESPYCQNALIAIYKTGTGVPRDAALADKWYDRFHKNKYVTTTTTRP